MSNGFELAHPELPRFAPLRAACPAQDPYATSQGALYRLALETCPPGDVVSLHAGDGRITLWLAAGVADRALGGRCFAIDEWPTRRGALGPSMAPDLHEVFRKRITDGGMDAHVEVRRLDPVHAGLAWERGSNVALLDFGTWHDYARLRRLYEAWSRFLRPGALLLLQGVPSEPAPTRLMSELPRWYRYRSALGSRWIMVRADDAGRAA